MNIKNCNACKHWKHFSFRIGICTRWPLQHLRTLDSTCKSHWERREDYEEVDTLLSGSSKDVLNKK